MNLRDDGLNESKLGQTLHGLRLQCGGPGPKRARWSLKRAGCDAGIVLPLESLVDVRGSLAAAKWSLALAAYSPGEKGASWLELDPETCENKMRVAGDAFLDPLCPDCTAALYARLHAE